MPSSFEDFVRQIEAEAEAEGPEAVRSLAVLRAHYEEEAARIRELFDRPQKDD